MRISETQIAYHSLNIDNNNLNLNIGLVTNIIAILAGVNIIREPRSPQKALSDAIIVAFNQYILGFSSLRADKLCHDLLNYQYDGIIQIGQNRIGVEIQFRPDFLKDITRFQIGFNSQRIDAMIYIVSINRRTIQENSSMPQFDAVNNHIEIFNWLSIPMIVIGVNCED